MYKTNDFSNTNNYYYSHMCGDSKAKRTLKLSGMS